MHTAHTPVYKLLGDGGMILRLFTLQA